MISRARAGGLAASPGPEGRGLSARATGTAVFETPLIGEGGSRMICCGELGGDYTRDMPKREHFKSGGYSRKFTPAPQGFRRYLLDRIPVPFWQQVQAKAKREKVSLRALILSLLEQWLKT